MSNASACELLVGGMTCVACTGAVRAALLKQPGVLQAQVEIMSETARVAYDGNAVTPMQLCKVVDELGFKSEALKIIVSRPTTNQKEDENTSVELKEVDSLEPSCSGVWTDIDEKMLGWKDEEGTSKEIKGKEETAACPSSSNSLATLRLLLQSEAAADFAAAAGEELSSYNGVLKCSYCPWGRGERHQQMQELIVTYIPEKVGARKLFSAMHKLGLNPQVVIEDPLDAQASTA